MVAHLLATCMYIQYRQNTLCYLYCPTPQCECLGLLCPGPFGEGEATDTAGGPQQFAPDGSGFKCVASLPLFDSGSCALASNGIRGA